MQEKLVLKLKSRVQVESFYLCNDYIVDLKIEACVHAEDNKNHELEINGINEE